MTATENTAGREKGRSRPKGYADWKPQARTRVLLRQVCEVLLEYEDHLPLTIRQIFYRLVGRHGYPKTELAYARLGEHLVRARRAKLIPFGAIRDDGIMSFSSPWYADPEAFWDDTGRRARRYRRDRQAGQRARMELWCEAAGMAPQLARVADEYSVPVYSTGGFSSLSAVRLIADRALERTTPTTILHLGDFDPSGEAMFAVIASDAAAFVEADRVVESLDLTAKRVALTREQVEAFRLETAPAKPTDSRSRNWTGGTCQLEALAPDALATLVREAIRSELDLAVYDRQVAYEAADRTELLRALPRGEE